MRPVFASPFLVRLRDRGAWPSLSHISHFFLTSRIFISHLAFLSRIFISHLAFISRISHFYFASCIFYLASRIFISHFYLTSRIFISHLAFFISHLAFLSRISHFLSRISHFFISHLAFLSRISHFLSRIYLQNFFSFFMKSHLECLLQASVLIRLDKLTLSLLYEYASTK